MDVEHEGVGQLADVVEATLGAPPLPLGDARLPHGHHDPTDQGQGDDSRGRDGHPVAPDELPDAIRGAVRTRNQGQALEVAPDVLRQLLCGEVPPRRLLA